jgi:hypothetical protein
VTLRGIGDVKDELNLLTGEVVEHIREIVLNGSESYSIHSNVTDGYSHFTLSINDISNTPHLLTCDKFITGGREVYEGTSEGIYHSGNKWLHFTIATNKLSENTVTGFKNWLNQNNVTIQYPLATESIKTVDLIPSGTHPSTTPYCWKDGHIQLSSSGLLPSLEYSVVTSRAGQISQNAAMIVKNDKRIFDLEILLAGGLVNTTYQALTLQNQVETGLSKVSLSSEKEPDYLLYHMPYLHLHSSTISVFPYPH